MAKNAPKRALVLSGGGARGSFQVGMLKNLILDRGLDFEVIRGVSVGSLNACILSQASTHGAPGSPKSLAALQEQVHRLESLWRDEIRGNHSVYKSRFAGFAGLVGGADSLHSFTPLESKIRDYVDLKSLRKSGRDFAVGTVSLVSSLYEEWTPDDERFWQMLLASSAIPVVFPFQAVPKTKDHPADVLVDGGVRAISPLSSAFKARPDEIWVLLASRLVRGPHGEFPETGTLEHEFEQWDDNWLGTKVDGMDVLKRTVDILTDEVYLDDIRNALKWNEICELADQLSGSAHASTAEGKAVVDTIQKKLSAMKRRHVDLYIIAPRQWYSHTNASTDFFPSYIDRAIRHGEAVAADDSLWFNKPAGAKPPTAPSPSAPGPTEEPGTTDPTV